jgi:hypothetical protein
MQKQLSDAACNEYKEANSMIKDEGKSAQTKIANRQPTASACPASLPMRNSGWAMPSNAPPPVLG